VVAIQLPLVSVFVTAYFGWLVISSVNGSPESVIFARRLIALLCLIEDE
jgi:hypothetical protein